MQKILLATTNKGKIVEISKALLDGVGLTLVTPAELGLTLEVVEDGQTYAENATKKAATFSQASGLIASGDDLGLEVEALGGQPGLHSHRFCPIPDATDADRRKYLLEKLHVGAASVESAFRGCVGSGFPSGRGTACKRSM